MNCSNDTSNSFGLLQKTNSTGKLSITNAFNTTKTTSTGNINSTDSESDLSSELSDNYKNQPLILSNQSINRLVEKNNELNKSNSDSPLRNYSLKDDLKISIDNSDWLNKRRPLIADIDLDQHFETINNEQLIFNQTNESFDCNDKSKLVKKELNKENYYCNGNLTNKSDHLNNKDHLTKDQPDHSDVLSTSSSSNHSPNSYSDELDANKIELRSVIRNIMCKNLGSSSDKSSTMSEEDETDEDENSVDCKAKLNDIKPSIKKSTIEHQDNEINKSKEKSILRTDQLSTIANNLPNNNDQYGDDLVDEDKDSVNYDSNNSEERTEEMISSKDDISNSNADDVITNEPNKCNKSNLKKKLGKKNRRVSFDPLALFLDAALEGELELVKKTAKQVCVII